MITLSTTSWLLYASPLKGASTSSKYHCCSTWQHHMMEIYKLVRRWATHDHDNELIMRPKNVLARYSFLIGVESWNIYKREWVLSDIWIDNKLSYFTILHSDLTHKHQTKKKSFIRLTTWKYCFCWLLSLSCLSFSYANGPRTLQHKTFYNCSTFIGTITQCMPSFRD
jgi:hypothetical protein